MNFAGKTVLVTGASRGIGRAIAQSFAERGARVSVNYHSNEAAALETVESLTGSGHFKVQGDVADPVDAEKIVSDSVSYFGSLDVVVNNAGIGHLFHPIATSTYEEWQYAWRKTIQTNLLGMANVCFCGAQHMMANGGGRIVNISSRGAFRGEPIKAAYGASKAGVNALSQSLAVALAPHNIFVGVVAPGFVDTDLAADRLQGEEGDSIRSQSPLNRVADPKEVAYAAVFLASEGAEFTTGCVIDVNGASYLRT